MGTTDRTRRAKPSLPRHGRPAREVDGFECSRERRVPRRAAGGGCLHHRPGRPHPPDHRPWRPEDDPPRGLEAIWDDRGRHLILQRAAHALLEDRLASGVSPAEEISGQDAVRSAEEAGEPRERGRALRRHLGCLEGRLEPTERTQITMREGRKRLEQLLGEERSERRRPQEELDAEWARGSGGAYSRINVPVSEDGFEARPQEVWRERQFGHVVLRTYLGQGYSLGLRRRRGRRASRSSASRRAFSAHSRTSRLRSASRSASAHARVRASSTRPTSARLTFSQSGMGPRFISLRPS
jgi:hypothetical protein